MPSSLTLVLTLQPNRHTCCSTHFITLTTHIIPVQLWYIQLLWKPPTHVHIQLYSGVFTTGVNSPLSSPRCTNRLVRNRSPPNQGGQIKDTTNCVGWSVPPGLDSWCPPLHQKLSTSKCPPLHCTRSCLPPASICCRPSVCITTLPQHHELTTAKTELSATHLRPG